MRPVVYKLNSGVAVDQSWSSRSSQGQRIFGVVAYVGSTLFASGKWVGVVIDEAVGKNVDSVQGKRYFDCHDNCGIVRQSQVVVLDEVGEETESPGMLTPKTPSPAVKRRSSGQPQSSGGRSGLKPPSAGIAKKETGQSLSAVSEPVAVVPEPKVPVRRNVSVKERVVCTSRWMISQGSFSRNTTASAQHSDEGYRVRPWECWTLPVWLE
ncbi:dynactin subunit 1-like [Corticium candelabrum]|uniref:dynactin subunit 1-like n=1 Tax=Corticium candelabrum TaxID=121492 RepID=UPI002E26333C|nr:dynactin subunit 1-like [Corticium candelabrum]